MAVSNTRPAMRAYRAYWLSQVVNVIYQILEQSGLGCVHAMAGRNDQNGGAEAHPVVRSADSLSCLCDIIQELKHLADRSGQRTLAAILAAALTEARIQNDEGRRG